MGPVRPQRPPEIVSADHFPRSFQEPAENSRRFRLQLDFMTSTRQPTQSCVELKTAKRHAAGVHSPTSLLSESVVYAKPWLIHAKALPAVTGPKARWALQPICFHSLSC